jgi:hypothetical protein
MSNPTSKFVWVPPLSSTISGCNFWDESYPVFLFGVVGCLNEVELQYDFYKKGYRPDLKPIGDCHYDGKRYYAVLDYNCQAPVCEDCLAQCSFGPCRVCGQEADMEVVSKRVIMEDKNWRRGESKRGFWMMIHTDANEFID